ncbi:NAD(P)/FAD-dependent oxidoreductase [Dechloromonas sp. XY25]|uniref:NAD(P)/FAD-dependent oxidoreductase n=1 Tax=Dechloromonas hankyongensis TaxID=2908002 RepID=A0ABS9JZB8_9RHOO|nr:NAD(P)/FAD-dependent oxidoreductase [Dechloromonas hankyongensis]MCG2576259.1 NAD(P)/FAD-dependent oxidoreductase [Dechloromonas hankyongensis]
MTELRFDAVVVGAGVVGLACARRLARLGLHTVLLEREKGIGRGISSRSSEVIHAGLYYPAGSLKSRLCQRGAERIYRYCERKSVAHRRVGKFVVATRREQEGKLEAIVSHARDNRCRVAMISGKEARRQEPELACVAALSSPDTGILDSHGLMDALLADYESVGGILARCSAVKRGWFEARGTVVELDDEKSTRVSSRFLVNAAGLDAPLVAANLLGFPIDHVPECYFAKGNYFVLTGRSPFSRLIYPMPEPGGLGIHLTLDLQGRARFGPDVEWVDAISYSVDIERRRKFCTAIRSYWPNCNKERLVPAYAGIRPKLGSRENVAEDFVIQDASVHGFPGLVNLFGIESPGLTSCLVIADEVAARLGLQQLEN